MNLTQALSCQRANEESKISSPVELSAHISLNLIIQRFLSVFLGFECRKELVMGYGSSPFQIASRRLPLVEGNSLCYLSASLDLHCINCYSQLLGELVSAAKPRIVTCCASLLSKGNGRIFTHRFL